MKFERMLDISYIAAFTVSAAGMGLLIFGISIGIDTVIGRTISQAALSISLFGMGGILVTRMVDDRM